MKTRGESEEKPNTTTTSFQKPRILTAGESNLIRGKILAGDASKSEILQLISHFDLVDQKLRCSLETLRTCMPDRVYVTEEPDETKWSADPPDDDQYFETVDFAELLDGMEPA